tara:strand:+ start:523 stop:678 length:156 start_codon:yes stop_codon:yes gene_type:complete
MKGSLKIRNAEVILPNKKQKVDVFVVDGRIDSIVKNILDSGEVIAGLFALW